MRRPLVIGVVNLTEDSFSDGGRYLEPGAALRHAHTLVDEGADVIELGPSSTHPDARPVSSADEIRRLEPVFAGLEGSGIPLAVDAFQPETQRWALAHGADVLVLDEATSSIDTETEALLQKGVHVLMEGKTALVIAHRLSTIQDVDRIYVLHKGRIVESGRHAELVAQGGVYHRLYRLQYAAQERIQTRAAV